MVRICIVALALMLTPLPGAAREGSLWQAPSGQYVLDPAKATVTISVRRFLMSRIQAQFTTIAGDMDVRADGQNSLIVEIMGADMEANGPIVESILQGKNFLNVTEHPTLVFAARGFEISDTPGTVTGNLTMGGQTHPATFTTHLDARNASDSGPRMRFTANATIARSDWGMVAHRGLVSNTIQVSIEVEFVRQDAEIVD